MKKNNLVIVFIMFLCIGLLIFFLPDIYNKVQSYEANKIIPPDIKQEKEDEKKLDNITMDSDVVKNLVYPIMRNDKYKIDSYYQLDSIDLSNFSNNDILYNAFLDIYEGYLINHASVGCTNLSKQFDATYLSSRIKNIIGRDTKYSLEDFNVPNINKNIDYVGLWKYDNLSNTYVYYGNCDKVDNNIIYYDYTKLYDLKVSNDNKILYLYYYVAFIKIENNHYIVYTDPNMNSEISSGDLNSIDDINNLDIDNDNLRIYRYTFKQGLCTYDNYCFYKGEWINDK